MLILATTISLALAWPVKAASPEKVRMWQRILPLPCGVDHITDIDGTDHYFAPRECGKLVVPSRNPVTSQGNSTPLPSGGGAVEYLDSSVASNSVDAYLLVTNKSMVYKFRLLGESQVAPYRTMEILGIDTVAQTIQLRFTPGDKIVTLHLGERLRADIAYDGAADLDITFINITSDGKVALRVWFPIQSLAVQSNTVHTTRDTFIAATIIVLALGLLFSTLTTVRRRTKKLWRAERHWKSVE